MKNVALVIIVALCGCAHVSGTRTAPDGSQLTITSTRWFWSSQDIDFHATDTNGLSAGLKVGKSNSDDASLAQLVELAKALQPK